MPNLWTRPLTVKRSAADRSGAFVAIAAAYSIDRGGDQFVPGSFKGAIAGLAKARLPILRDHDPTKVLGAVVSAAETDVGLEIAGQLCLGVSDAAEAYELMSAGAMSMSVGFNILPGCCKILDDGVRQISGVDLGEVSLTALPMNADCVITQVKFASAREFERAVREKLSLSARQARRLASGGWAALAGAEESAELDDDELDDTAARIERLISTI